MNKKIKQALDRLIVAGGSEDDNWTYLASRLTYNGTPVPMIIGHTVDDDFGVYENGLILYKSNIYVDNQQSKNVVVCHNISMHDKTVYVTASFHIDRNSGDIYCTYFIPTFSAGYRVEKLECVSNEANEKLLELCDVFCQKPDFRWDATAVEEAGASICEMKKKSISFRKDILEFMCNVKALPDPKDLPEPPALTLNDSVLTALAAIVPILAEIPVFKRARTDLLDRVVHKGKGWIAEREIARAWWNIVHLRFDAPDGSRVVVEGRTDQMYLTVFCENTSCTYVFNSAHTNVTRGRGTCDELDVLCTVRIKCAWRRKLNMGSPRMCFMCATAEGKLSVCSGCRYARYCSPACQKQDWMNHKFECLTAMNPV